MSEMGFIVALTLGLAASTHCLLMCGPLSAVFMSGRGNGASSMVITSHAAALNLGRVTTYLLMAWVSVGIVQVVGTVVNYQYCADLLRVLLGVSMIAAGLQLLLRQQLMRWLEAGGRCAFKRLKGPIQSLLHKPSIEGTFSLGILWGLVPCGMVYSLILMAAATGTYLSASSTVLGFGLGTFPVLFAASAGSSFLSGILRSKQFQQISGGFIILAGLWTLLLPLHNIKLPMLAEPHEIPGITPTLLQLEAPHCASPIASSDQP